MLLVVTYHYLAEEPPPRPRAIFPVTVAQLEAQLRWLAAEFELVSGDDILRALDERRGLPARACLVTFDDGLRCQSDLGVPVLERVGAPGLFFVPAAPLAEGAALPVHKAHRIREELGEEEILSATGTPLPPAPAGTHLYDEPRAAAVKELLAARPAAELDALLSRAGCAPDDLSRDLYLTGEQVRELARRGWLGGHGYSHRPLAALDQEHARADLERGASALAEATGQRPRTVSYPHGGADADTARAAAAAGYRAGFTTERAVNLGLDEPLLLARLDANDVPGGRLPLLALDGDRVTVKPGATLGRRRHLSE
jgi:peptidoglycan/xylan/chitin deacetylase (PgdA/CDA1 family)